MFSIMLLLLFTPCIYSMVGENNSRHESLTPQLLQRRPISSTENSNTLSLRDYRKGLRYKISVNNNTKKRPFKIRKNLILQQNHYIRKPDDTCFRSIVKIVKICDKIVAYNNTIAQGAIETSYSTTGSHECIVCITDVNGTIDNECFDKVIEHTNNRLYQIRDTQGGKKPATDTVIFKNFVRLESLDTNSITSAFPGLNIQFAYPSLCKEEKEKTTELHFELNTNIDSNNVKILKIETEINKTNSVQS